MKRVGETDFDCFGYQLRGDEYFVVGDYVTTYSLTPDGLKPSQVCQVVEITERGHMRVKRTDLEVSPIYPLSYPNAGFGPGWFNHTDAKGNILCWRPCQVSADEVR